MTIMRQAGFVVSPISFRTGNVSKAMAMENTGAPNPTMNPMNWSILFLFILKIPLV